MKLKAKIQIGSTPLYDVNVTVIKMEFSSFCKFWIKIKFINKKCLN
jgi:hypothetical protein